jgi:hypothetical protein
VDKGCVLIPRLVEGGPRGSGLEREPESIILKVMESASHGSKWCENWSSNAHERVEKIWAKGRI